MTPPPPDRRRTADRRRGTSADLYQRIESKRADIENERRHSVRRSSDGAEALPPGGPEPLPHVGASLETASRLRRATLLWQLSHSAEAPVECLAMQLHSGRTVVEIVRMREQAVSGIFENTTSAVRWALALERSLLAKGWAKTI